MVDYVILVLRFLEFVKRIFFTVVNYVIWIELFAKKASFQGEKVLLLKLRCFFGNDSYFDLLSLTVEMDEAKVVFTVANLNDWVMFIETSKTSAQPALTVILNQSIFDGFIFHGKYR